MSNGGPTGSKVVSDLGKRLLEAARLGNADEVSSLMTNGAPLTTDWLGTTPLHLASIYGHTSTAEILIKSGISKDGRTKVDKAPLHFACQHGHLGVVKLLVNDGAYVNATDMLKMTPLHWAVESNSFDICLFLLKAGGKPDLKNKFNKTALNIASDKGYDSIVKLLSDEKFRVIQEIDVLHRNVLRDRQISSIQICRSENFNTVNNLIKKQKTRRFPMVAGTWTGGEARLQERLEINEHKKLAIFKRRHQQRDSLAHSLLQNLQPVKMTPRIYDGKSKENDNQKSRTNGIVSSDGSDGSHLIKLEQTVHLSTSAADLAYGSATNATSKTASSSASYPKCDVNVNLKVNPTSTSSLLFTLPHTSIEIPVVSPHAIQSGTVSDLPMKNKIPVVTSLSDLPENVQAIPLHMTTTEFKKLELQNKPAVGKGSPAQLYGSVHSGTGGSIFSIPVDQYMNSPATVIVPHALSSTNLENETVQKSNTPVHLPVNILNQILDGNVTLLSLSDKTEGDSDGQFETLPGITTEMGTIPLIPVSGEGGLRLIPVEDRQSVSPPDSPTQLNVACDDENKLSNDRDVHDSASAPQDTINSSPLFVPARISYPNLPILMDNHSGVNMAGPVFTNQSIPAGFINGTQIQSPVVMPTGIYLHPGQATLLPVPIHPAYIQPTGQAYIQSAFVQPMLHPSIAQPILHPPPVFHTRQLQNLPQYVLMDKSSGVYSHQLQQLPTKSSPPSSDTFQEPDSSTEQ